MEVKDILNFGVEELENPRLTMAFGILVGMTCVALIYITINIAFFVVLTVDEVLQSGRMVVYNLINI